MTSIAASSRSGMERCDVPGSVIAVVEDELLIGFDLVYALEQVGFRARYAASARVAIKQATEDGLPAGLVADVRLGRGGDGIALAQTLQGMSDAPLPVIFATASDDPETRARAALCKPIAFVVKPYNPREIAALMRRALPIAGEEAG